MAAEPSQTTRITRPAEAAGPSGPVGSVGPNGVADPLLTAVEVAKLLRVTTGWLYAETRAGRVPHVRLGRYVRYRRSGIERWLATLERESTRPVTQAPVSDLRPAARARARRR